MSVIANEGSGLVIYEYQEGRGIGLKAQLRAYALQDQGLDTIEANEALGFDADCRDFSLAVAVLHELKIRQVRLMSNNPKKVEAISSRRATFSCCSLSSARFLSSISVHETCQRRICPLLSRTEL
jgi:GTP cyclohydrolase II